MITNKQPSHKQQNKCTGTWGWSSNNTLIITERVCTQLPQNPLFQLVPRNNWVFCILTTRQLITPNKFEAHLQANRLQILASLHAARSKPVVPRKQHICCNWLTDRINYVKHEMVVNWLIELWVYVYPDAHHLLCVATGKSRHQT